MIKSVRGEVIPEIVDSNDDIFNQVYNPDVLLCLANLSNDEVFTPPDIANKILDLLPQDLFCDPNTKFLDPACKSGVMLREIAKRLIIGLEDEYPDLQERIDHICKNQLYGIAITELTSLLTRRSIYCSKYPNGPFSIAQFSTVEGNIRFKSGKHYWKDGKCIFCGASEEQFGDKVRKNLELHAYEFIHINNPQEIFNMKFDVIISNPPYQLNTAGDSNGAQAKPIYQMFVENAKKMNPKYIAMITPSRWFAGGWGLDDFRNSMITENKLRVIHDYTDASECFPGVEIKGGVSYFLWDRDYNGMCDFVSHKDNKIISKSKRYLKEDGCDILIRYNEAIPILKKVQRMEEESFATVVSRMRPFGLPTNLKGNSSADKKDSVKVYANKRIEYQKSNSIEKNFDLISAHKLIVPKAVGSGEPSTDRIKPIYCEPGSCCTETYLMIGPFEDKKICDNVQSYIETKFFHFLVTLLKNSQDCLQRVYQFVPLQDFSKPWTDEELYKKYGLSEFDIKYIEDLIWSEKE